MTEQREANHKIWIRNTQILSMTGAALQSGDILIENDKIAVIGANTELIKYKKFSN